MAYARQQSAALRTAIAKKTHMVVDLIRETQESGSAVEQRAQCQQSVTKLGSWMGAVEGRRGLSATATAPSIHRSGPRERRRHFHVNCHPPRARPPAADTDGEVPITGSAENPRSIAVMQRPRHPKFRPLPKVDVVMMSSAGLAEREGDSSVRSRAASDRLTGVVVREKGRRKVWFLREGEARFMKSVDG